MYEFITLIKEETVSSTHAKQIMFAIIDGDERMPCEIAKDYGFVGEVTLS